MTRLHRQETLVLTADASRMDGVPKWGEARFNADNELVIKAKGFTHQLTLCVEDSLILGRKSEGMTSADFVVDLNVFEAYMQGVSKQHAIIEFSDRVLTIRDLGSKNGTYLNMQALPANSHRILRDNDIIHLGNLELHVHFQVGRR
ncbi:MAG: FHA domain-containing protein [Chloroflexi bacterium]|nr:FHA domain-containing protein [Chloroflexota bacterium]